MKKFKLTICHTSDVHGYVMPYSYADNLDAPIGLSKVAKVVEQYDNKLLIDTGDLLQGSALATYLSKNEGPSAYAKIMNQLSYDYFIVGNHDFNYGQDYLKEFTSELNAKVLSANIYKEGNLFDSFDIIQNDNGPRIAVIGLTTHYIPNWENPVNIEGIKFRHELIVLDEILGQLENIDYSIVAYHGGFNRDISTDLNNPNETGENSGSDMLLRNIDCLLTGHQHQRIIGIKNDVIYSQPGCNGSQVNTIELEFEFDSKWNLKNSELNEVIVSEFDDTITKIVAEPESKTQDWLDIPIGSLKDGDCLITDALDARLNKSPLVTLINQAQLEVSSADIACCSLGNEVSGFNQNITMRDIISTYIYPNTLVVFELDGHTIKKAIEKSAEFFTYDGEIKISDHYLYPKKELYNYDMFDGINYTIDLSKEYGNRVHDIVYKGSTFDLEKKYSVVMNNYRAAGGGNFTMFKGKTVLKTIEKDMVEILSTYISKQKIVTLPKTNNIKIKE